MPNFIEIKKLVYGWTDVRTHAHTDGWTFETSYIRNVKRSKNG